MKILVTAGPTREKLDPVRFLSNRSTGKMGYAIACAARDAGHDVTLVSGPVALAVPGNVCFVPVESAADMAEAVFSKAADQDMIIMAAAVADYRPSQVEEQKIKKQDGEFFLRLERTTDILAGLGKMKRPGQLLVGFAAETENLLENARGKLERKNLDFIAANSVADGFGTDTDTVILLGRDGGKNIIGPASKQIVAKKLIEIVTTPKGNI
ncbi:MAG: bifunctional phosphopantothenoylcysteine decarboxylase/phosphopantothenate--cysteine ligase CoaBC [Lentisphaerae bacterium]|nr:bifunctional phosphopantothenoylcysteine decarboxylase/phosphopantothenate--cysteine ligase CoaBC [Lentisphaerota bacterium]